MLASVAQSLSRRLERTLEVAGALVLAALLATVTLSVALRYLAASGFTGTEEAASWLLVGLVSIGLPLVSTAGGLRINLFEGGSSPTRGRDSGQAGRDAAPLREEFQCQAVSRARRVAARDLRTLFSGVITLLACIVLISGSGRAR
ncbi:hypothetical protein [Ensifer canadensis]